MSFDSADHKEKGIYSSLPTDASDAQLQPQPSRRRHFLKPLVFLCLLGGIIAVLDHPSVSLELGGYGYKTRHSSRPSAAAGCGQVDPLTPSKTADLWRDLNEKFNTESFKTKAIEWISKAVQIPTESYDSMDPVGVDPRWDAFGPFHDYLNDAFPLAHNALKKSTVNTWGLLYEWTGSDSSLKPLLLMAHQDVVPVEPKTVDEWEHPPYSGYYDGKYIWGRGSSDDKSGLIGIMVAIETLIKFGWTPTRTIVLAFGFDEETSGLNGASELGKAMLQIYGENAFGMIVDEGGGFGEQYGYVFATPGVAEKGYLDTRVEIASPGGHSSVPPDHTSIGMLAALLTHYEQTPDEVFLTTEALPYDTLTCYAEHGVTMPKKLRSLIKCSSHSKMAMKALEKVLSNDKMQKALLTTTQAIDLINGGVKTNALPEQAWAVVNHRINTLSSVAEIQDFDTKRIAHLADKFNLTFTAFGKAISTADAPSKGRLTLSDAFDNALEPAPRTPIRGDNSKPWQVLSGTIKSTYNAHRGLKGDNIAVAPGMSTGNTDTRYYWKLSPHIFRYNHRNGGKKDNRLGGAHTVNENLEADGFVEVVRFFATLILNVDESTVV